MARSVLTPARFVTGACIAIAMSLIGCASKLERQATRLWSLGQLTDGRLAQGLDDIAAVAPSIEPGDRLRDSTAEKISHRPIENSLWPLRGRLSADHEARGRERSHKKPLSAQKPDISLLSQRALRVDRRQRKRVPRDHASQHTGAGAPA